MQKMGKTSLHQYNNTFNKTHASLNTNHNNNNHEVALDHESHDPIPQNGVDSLSEVFKDVDEFLATLSSIDDKSSTPPNIPDSLKTLSENLESTIARYNAEEGRRFGKIPEEDSFFLESVRRIYELSNALSHLPPDRSIITFSLNQSSVALHRAMTFIEAEFRLSLDHADVAKMREIASSMISAGYETECCHVYNLARRNAIRNRMSLSNTLSVDDVVKMPWEALEAEIARWVKTVNTWSNTVLPGEKRLGESVFVDHPSFHFTLHVNIVRTTVIQLLDFAEAAVAAPRSAEKLFKYLDMYEALRGLGVDDELVEEVSATIDRVGESVAKIFAEIEGSIGRDGSRTTPVPGGAVHPLTRYVMNYMKYACEYRETLERLVPFSRGVVRVMELLDVNLERKSRLYKEAALRSVFMMNNGRYVLQKVKGSGEMKEAMGDEWCRRRSMEVREYHKSYQRETWGRVLRCLSHEGLVVENGKANKKLLKERFKVFTTVFEEIHRTQSGWVASDEQLRSELRVSISSVVIPAYRGFVGRFRQYLESGKHVERYIKYQPEDIEGLIEGLFEGNTASMIRRRK